MMTILLFCPRVILLNYVASAVAVLHLNTAATVCSFKLVSVTKAKFLDVISRGADSYQK